MRHYLSAILISLLLTTNIQAAQSPQQSHTRTLWPPNGELRKFVFSRDTGVSSVDQEKNNSKGGAKKLKLKGQQEFVLFDIDTSQIRGKLISGAILKIQSASPIKAPLGRIGLSSISSPWNEGTARWLPKQRGSSTFAQANFQQSPWTSPDSTVMDVIFGRGHTIWNFADCTQPDQQGWQECAVEPDVIAARVAGLSEGFALFDEVGTEWSIRDHKFKLRWFPNRYFHSRESGSKHAPHLKIWLAGEDRKGPSQIDSFTSSSHSLPTGQALLNWNTPKDEGEGHTLGFKIYYWQNDIKKPIPPYLIPMAGNPGEKVTMHIRDIPFKAGEKLKLQIIPVDSAGNHGAPSIQEIRVSKGVRLPEIPETTIKPFPPYTSLPKIGGVKISVIDLLDKIDPHTGKMIPPKQKGYKRGNHIFSASDNTIRLQAARNETVHFQLNLSGRAEEISIKYSYDDKHELKTKIFKFDHVQSLSEDSKKSTLLPDPLIPITSSHTFSIPSQTGKVSMKGQQNQSIIAQLYIPHQANPGLHKGSVIIKINDQQLTLNVGLTIWDFTLPNKLSFVPEMNTYGTVSPYKSYDYYRMAHEHRTCINRLPYGWHGKPSFSPIWDEKEENFDWQKWDKKVGPILDGTAFSDLPRAGEPVDVFYLPFNENWPINIFRHYTPSYWIDEALDDSYKVKLQSAMSKFTKHLSEKSWDQTSFQFYLNNKISHRQKLRRSSAPWFFDEPVNTQDFWALRWYGLLWRKAVTPYIGKVNLHYRADISYSQFSRDILWGITDIEYLGGNTSQKTRMKQTEATLKGGGFFAEYGSANHIDQANTQPVLWCISAWSKGAKSVLPWQTIGTKDSWQTASQTSLFYPSPNGPIPSVRLKAFTRGQQDTEYLEILSKLTNVPRFAIAKLLNNLLRLDEIVKKNNQDDAGTLHFRPTTATELWDLRYRIGSFISKHAPKYERSLTADTSIARALIPQRPIGYVSPAPIVESRKPDCDNFVQ